MSQQQYKRFWYPYIDDSLNEAKEILSELADYGFTACQLVYKPDIFTHTDADTIKKVSKKYGVEISAVFCSTPDNETVWDIYYGYLTTGINIEAYKAE